MRYTVTTETKNSDGTTQPTTLQAGNVNEVANFIQGITSENEGKDVTFTVRREKDAE